jgi:hypothetical protein
MRVHHRLTDHQTKDEEETNGDDGRWKMNGIYHGRKMAARRIELDSV